jgi:hypothetical protein
MNTGIELQTTAGGTCPQDGHVVAFADGRKTATCPLCSTSITLTTVTGTYSDKVPCNQACQYATGPMCTCVCGGENHQAGYIDAVTVPATIRTRDAARHTTKVVRIQTKATAAQAAATAQLIADFPALAALLTDRYAGADGPMGDAVTALKAGTLTGRQCGWASRTVIADATITNN